MKEAPVPVVGGGAAGTMLTLELARRGVKPLTVDRLPKASETSNAITVHARRSSTCASTLRDALAVANENLARDAPRACQAGSAPRR